MSETVSRVALRQDKIVAEFSALGTWEDKYRKLIEKGKSLGDLPEELKTEDLKVRGCQSQVWLHASFNNGQIDFRGDSDAMIVKGLVAILMEVYSGSTPTEILSASPEFLKKLGFDTHLSPSRANGLYAMLKQMVYYATAYAALAKTTGR